MTEPQLKPSEHLPLLKGGTEAGDHIVVIPATEWSPPPKKPILLKSRLHLSELFFAFWVTLTIVIIGILMFYVFASVYYDVKWSTMSPQNLRHKTTNNRVTLHYLTGRVTDVPFTTFNKVISEMAVRFPKLQFDVKLLFYSDSRKDFVKFKQGWSIVNQENRNNIMDVVNKHKNVLFEFKPVSELRYLWEYMSLGYLRFYAAVYEVWLKGGIAFDLEILTKKYQYGRLLDKRIETMLQNYNDGNGIQYNDIIFDEQRKVAEAELNLSFFLFDIFEQLINDTRGMFSMEPFGRPNNQVITNRFKREAIEMTSSNETDKANNTVVANKNITKETHVDTSALNTNTSDILTVISTEKLMPTESVISTEKSATDNSVKVTRTSMFITETTEVLNASALIEPRKLFLFFPRPSFPKENKEWISSQQLYMSRDGSFVATKFTHNPFLSKILLERSCLHITPEYTIEKLYMEQCGAIGMCDKVHIF